MMEIEKTMKENNRKTLFICRKTMYIALDLETTGFESVTDQIIEIAAIKFDGDKVIETFETLVNPEIPIPGIITHITGIKAEDLVDAPKFHEIEAKLMEFLGNDPIIGHNINFDVTFLKQKGLPLQNPLYDTIQLATILLPDLPSYSLDTLTRLLKIEHKNKHRAMSDTEACYYLFLLLEKKISDIDAKTYLEIKNALDKSTWELKTLFEKKYALLCANSTFDQFQLSPAGTLFANNHPELNNKKNDSADFIKISSETGPVEKENLINAFYEPNGLLAKTIKDYEKRPTQQTMSEQISKTFAENRHLLVEAGTGTGKTMAYLLSAILWATEHNEKIVISTYTHNLQNQVLKNDIPILRKALESQNIHFNAALLKGRKNYLSLERLKKFKTKNTFLDHEITFLIKILLWLNRTESGDLEELSLQGKELTLLDEVCCAEYVCMHNQDSEQDCYLTKARKDAEKADIIIVNHALLLQQEIMQSSMMPEYHYLIIDEAHHLEKVATDSLTLTLSLNPFERPFLRIPRIIEQLEREKSPFLENTEQNLFEAKSKIDHLVSRIEILFGLLGIFLEKHLHPGSFQYHFHLHEKDFQTQDWQKIRDSGHSIIQIGTEVTQGLSIITDRLSENGVTNAELEKSLQDCRKNLQDLKTVLSLENKNHEITWIFKSYEESIGIKNAPLSIGESLNKLLFENKKSIILTSATLKTDNTFAYIRDQLQLKDKTDELTLPSHFDYPDQVKILIPEDLTEPASDGYFVGCADLITDIIQKNGGRTLALFTSKKALAATYHRVAPYLKEQGFTVLAQQITGGRGKILEHFKDEPQNCAIFGLNSFWEGVDIKGSDLTCVIIQKLPFDPPDDPIIQARCQKYRDNFSEYMLPRAILRFKQGFGRLIRSSKDTGSIVILDSRILQKAYGHSFLESLPPGIKIKYGTKESLGDLL